MTEVKRFLFDRRFDIEGQPEEDPEESTEEEEEEEEEPEEIVPTFSEEEMKAAREKSFAAGKKEGIEQAAAATEREILGALEKLNEQFTGLFKAQEEADASILDSAVSVAVGIARKVFPAMNERNGLGEIERMVVMAMEKILEEPQVTIYVNPGIEAPLKERLAPMTAKAGYKGEVQVVAADDIAAADCRVEWNGGGALRTMDVLWREIDEIVERNLSDVSKTPAQTPSDATDQPIETIDEMADPAGGETPGAKPGDTPDDTPGDRPGETMDAAPEAIPDPSPERPDTPPRDTPEPSPGADTTTDQEDT